MAALMVVFCVSLFVMSSFVFCCLHSAVLLFATMQGVLLWHVVSC